MQQTMTMALYVPKTVCMEESQMLHHFSSKVLDEQITQELQNNDFSLCVCTSFLENKSPSYNYSI